MSWLPRRPVPSSDPALVTAFGDDFAAVVRRAFPVDDAAVDHVRSGVLGAFAQADLGGVPAVRRRRHRRGWGVALTASAGLLAVSVASVQAGPGSPLYPVRLSLETVTLPTVDSAAGWQARLDRLGERLRESLAAEADHDPGAMAAALDEYRLELRGLVAGTVDTGQRAALVELAAGDLETVIDLDQAFPSPAAALLIADLRGLIAPPPAGGSASPGRDEPISGNPHADGTTGNPHADGTIGNPHGDGETGNPHDGGTPGGGTTGNPHADGTTGDPHAGGSGTGDPHSNGTRGNPHSNGQTGNPHAGTTSGQLNGNGSSGSKNKP